MLPGQRVFRFILAAILEGVRRSIRRDNVSGNISRPTEPRRPPVRLLFYLFTLIVISIVVVVGINAIVLF